jgi:hypothetical protein
MTIFGILEKSGKNMRFQPIYVALRKSHFSVIKRALKELKILNGVFYKVC